MIYTRESVLGLIQEKEKVEEALKELWDVLKSVRQRTLRRLIPCKNYNIVSEAPPM